MNIRNVHAWKMVNEDGEKREVRAEKFGKNWRIQAKLRHEENWTYYDTPLMEDLLELRDVVWRKYQRKRLSFDDLAAVDKLIRDRGGVVPGEEASEGAEADEDAD